MVSELFRRALLLLFLLSILPFVFSNDVRVARNHGYTENALMHDDGVSVKCTGRVRCGILAASGNVQLTMSELLGGGPDPTRAPSPPSLFSRLCERWYTPLPDCGTRGKFKCALLS
jgi:hypothetical protein